MSKVCIEDDDGVLQLQQQQHERGYHTQKKGNLRHLGAVLYVAAV